MESSFVNIINVNIQIRNNNKYGRPTVPSTVANLLYIFLLEGEKYPISRYYRPILQIKKWNLGLAKPSYKVMKLVSRRTGSKPTFMFSRFLTEALR